MPSSLAELDDDHPNDVPLTKPPRRLFRGHFVVDNEVPSILLDQCANTEGNEFTRMRYTAITCDPNDFVVSPCLSSARSVIGIEIEVRLCSVFWESGIDECCDWGAVRSEGEAARGGHGGGEAAGFVMSCEVEMRRHR